MKSALALGLMINEYTAGLSLNVDKATFGIVLDIKILPFARILLAPSGNTIYIELLC
jgi:hypothetical protein